MADIATLARDLYEAWNERDYDRMAESMQPDGQIMIVGAGDVFEGPDGVVKYNKMWADAFPDGRVTVDRLHVAGDCAIVEFTGRGKHTGTLVTSAGTVPATGRSVTLQLCDVLEFSGDKVRAQRTYFDSGSLMAQLGVTSPATAGTTTQ